MTKAIFNWRFKDVETFLKRNGFVLNHTNGSHFYYRGTIEDIVRNVCVPFHGNQAIKPRTLKGIILQSGIPQKEWLK